MESFSKIRYLLLVQLDSISGETAGAAIELLYEAGALNVQLINTITKKNRPGFMYIIDCGEEKLDAVENTIVRELGTTGWHRLQSEHRFIAVSTEERVVMVKAGGSSFEFTAQRKISSANPDYIRPEHDSCMLLKAQLMKNCGIAVPLSLVRERLCEVFRAPAGAKYVINFD